MVCIVLLFMSLKVCLQVGVHIADVSHFIRPGNAMDKEASNRGTTVYLVDKVSIHIGKSYNDSYDHRFRLKMAVVMVTLLPLQHSVEQIRWVFCDNLRIIFYNSPIKPYVVGTY